MKRQFLKKAALLTAAALLTTGLTGCGALGSILFSGGGNDERGENSTASIEIPIYDITDEDTESVVDHLDDLPISEEVFSQTVMIYMVGSDLESRHGCASEEFTEMLASIPDTERHNILVCAGGTSEWQNDIVSDEDELTLLRLGPLGFEVIDSKAEANMGETTVLQEFLTYGMGEYETDKYSLILWDHGGGPVLGYGVDENYNDSLHLPEMQEAILNASSETGKRLEMIGFDACLMSTLEIADVMSECADYLVASQETEPGVGWDYRFLELLDEPGMDGAHLGAVIVDSYFGYFESMGYADRFDLTLSCLDLTKYQAAEDAVNTCFSTLGPDLDASTLPVSYRKRDRVREFAKFSSDFDYGLIDAMHLFSQFSVVDEAEAARTAIEEMVVYSRSNMTNATGVSICFPRKQERNGYADAVLRCFETLDFAPAYADYLESWYAIQRGEQADVDWSIRAAVSEVMDFERSAGTENVTAVTSGKDITLQLTAEQQENFASASFWILRKAESMDVGNTEDEPRIGEMYLNVHRGGNVQMDETGKLHAYYSDNVVYMLDGETGERSPIPMVMTDNDSSTREKRYTSNVVLFELDDFSSIAAKLQIVVNEKYPEGTILSAVPLADAESTEFTAPSKQLLELDDYDLINVVGSCRYITRNAEGGMEPFAAWEQSGWMMGFEQDLNAGWELDVAEIEDPEEYVCMFEIEDVHGNIICSELIPLG